MRNQRQVARVSETGPPWTTTVMTFPLFGRVARVTFTVTVEACSEMQVILSPAANCGAPSPHYCHSEERTTKNLGCLDTRRVIVGISQALVAAP